MDISYSEKDRENIAKIYERYGNLTEKQRIKAENNFKKLLDSNEAPRYIYVIRCYPYNYYKIGITNKILKRIETHQTGCPFKLIFVFAVEADESDFLGFEITYLEKFIHKYYKKQKKHIRGEWFHLSEDDLTSLCLFLQDNDFDILEKKDGADELKAYHRLVHQMFLLEEGEE